MLSLGKFVRCSLLSFTLVLPSLLSAYVPPPNDTDYLDASNNIFRRNEVAIVEITLDPGDFQDLLDDPYSDESKHATMRWNNSQINETITDVAFRVRGNLSRSAARKSWKVDINEYVPDRSFHGLEAFQFNGEPNDPTLLRRMLAHEFLRRMGLPAMRSSYIALYVNGDFQGIRVNSEHIDEEFADSWFGNKDGNLYKCLYQDGKADLAFRAAEDYQAFGNGTVYEEHNNEPLSDYTDLKNFIRLINQAPASEVFSTLDQQFDTDSFLRLLAADVGIGSWDDYWYGSNNYYLYHDTGSGRLEWIPYDYDNSLGTDFSSTNWAARDFEDWSDGGFGTQPAPLVEAVFDHSPWRRQFRRYLLMAADILSDPEYQALAAQYHAMLKPWFDGTLESGGTVGKQDNGGQFQPYFESYNLPATYAGGRYHTLGILPYMNQRAASLRQQIDDFVSPTTPLPAVRINEVVAGNGTIIADNAGEFDDWIEIYNGENTAVDVSGWYLTDNVTEPMKYKFPAGTTIAAHGFLLVWADSQPEQQTSTQFHAPFALALGGEPLGLFMDDANGRVLVDHLEYQPLITNRSFGRFTDGSDTLMEFTTVTPLAPNDDTPGGGGGEPRTPPRVFINEFMADNDATVADNMGDFDDWVELYNDETTEVDLGGMHLTDSLTNPTKWTIPGGVTIPAKGFLIVWADSEPLETAAGFPHASFSLGKGGEDLGLFDNDENNAQPIHSFSFGAQITGESMGLLPDGVGTPQALDSPTPGASNVVAPPILAGDVNGDNEVTPSDAQLAFECFLLGACPAGSDPIGADFCTGDGITPHDSQMIFEKALGLGGPFCTPVK